MWFCEGEDVTSSSEVKQPATTRPSRQSGAHQAATRAEEWGGDGNDHALLWLNIGDTNRMDGRGRGQGPR